MSRNASDYVRVCQRCSHTARMKVSWSNIKLCDTFPCVLVLSLEADRQVRGHCFTGSHVDGPTSMMVVISLPPHMHGHKPVLSMLPHWLYTYIHTHLRANVKFSNSQLSSPPFSSLCRGAAVGSFPCRSKLWEERKSTGMKTAVSLWENTPHYKALLPPPPLLLLLLLHCHGNGGESMCWSQSLKVTQYLHVLIISAPYEKNITSLVSMMKIRIRSLQSVHCSNEHGEPAIKVKTRKWTTRILVSLAKMQVDEAWFQPVTGLYYFWLGLFKRDKIGQNYWCVSLWNRKSWEEKKEVESLKKDGNSQGNTFSKAVTGSSFTIALWRWFFSPRCLCQRWSSRWATGSAMGTVEAGPGEHPGILCFPPDPSLDTHKA